MTKRTSVRAIVVFFDWFKLEVSGVSAQYIMLVENKLDLEGMQLRWCQPVDQLVDCVQVIDVDSRSWMPEIRPLEVVPTIEFAEFKNKHLEWMMSPAYTGLPGAPAPVYRSTYAKIGG